ncbi:MAG TPA: sigma-70 family RNA polymerase sigma factor [Thermoanaerobaculia bacterium]|nr:sigma-70 family RNA polymerase sigma factor [Thermoanaerobaculia bacterium]
MDAALMTSEQDRKIAAEYGREERRLRNFIRKHVVDDRDVEDVLQDVFYELVQAYRMLTPVEHVTAWLFRIARNRITDLFRRRRPEVSIDEEPAFFADLLPSAAAGPDAVYARTLLLEELTEAFDELPEEQRDAFIAHELEGRSFKEIAAQSGVNVNTLISRKHYAVVHLRRRLRAIHDDIAQERS